MATFATKHLGSKSECGGDDKDKMAMLPVARVVDMMRYTTVTM